MNKNTIIGFILMGLVLFGFSWYNQPSEKQINAQRKQDSIENVLKEKAEREQMAKAAAKKVQAEAAVSDSTQLFFPALQSLLPCRILIQHLFLCVEVSHILIRYDNEKHSDNNHTKRHHSDGQSVFDNLQTIVLSL